MVQTSNPHHHHNNDHKTLVLKSAIYSRILLISLIIFFRTLASPYDTSASLNPPCLTTTVAATPNNTHRSPIASAIENGIVWDSVYFVRSAQCGYEYEQSYAFLPLLPLSISFLSPSILSSLLPQRSLFALSAYLINNLAFVLAALYFYRLSIAILKDPEIALRATVLFCFNPASIFYSSIYSESLYAVLSLGGLYYFVSGKNNLSVLLLALSGCARSNGVLNAGYICFQTMHRGYHALFHNKNVTIAVVGALRSICIFAPFVAFQAYGYYNMCVGRFPDERRPWCNARIPLLYNYIQSHYWNVGFLRYFQLKQLPNFLLASPILSLAFYSVVHYAKSRPQIFYSLGFDTTIEEKSCGVVFLSEDLLRSKVAGTVEKSSVRAEEHFNVRRRKNIIKGDVSNVPIESEPEARSGYLSASVLPFVLHLGFMAGTAFLVMHVQVSANGLADFCL
ncbi:GPI mannosyltransferase 2-like protein [Trifolium pratense]|uniref:GPI mannosyltransferase 2 n=1 Tax=Trifolium pratense TaxID=57577 RepID=A0A2K3NPJ2_TRIPR|nr:GPI mannosyltransferase 2-like protein [Trifolium pratense]